MIGEKKRCELARQETLRDIVEYVRAYQYSLNAAVAVLSAEAASAKQSRTVGVGRTQIWPCFDGGIRRHL